MGRNSNLISAVAMAAAIAFSAGCGGEGNAQDYDGDYYGPNDAQFIAEEIRELEAMLPQLPPEDQAALREEINFMRAELGTLQGGAPQPQGYGASQQQGYGAPQQQGYGAPQQQGYGAPQQQGYGAPQQQSPARQAPARGGKPLANGALPKGALRVKPFQMMDRNGFEKPLVAATLLAPADWTDEGGVVWNVQDPCNRSGYNFSYQVKSGDGLSSATIFPVDRWQWVEGMHQQGGGCRFERFASMEAWLRGMVPKLNANARIVSYRQRTDMIEAARGLVSNTPMPGGGMRTHVDAGEALLEYVENGTPVREQVVVMGAFNESWMEGSMGMPGYRNLFAQTFPGWSYKAPADKFDAKIGEAMRLSYRAGPEWSARISKAQAKMSRDNLESQRKIGEINRQANAEISDMINRGYKERSAIQERGRREFSEAIRGVETYDDAFAPGGQVELDFNYDNAWRLDDGTYILTNDANFAPLRDIGVDGRRLSASR